MAQNWLWYKVHQARRNRTDVIDGRLITSPSYPPPEQEREP